MEVLFEKIMPIIINGKITKYDISNFGKVFNRKTGKLIKPHFDGKYLTARLSINGKVRGYKIHRLVANAFIEKIEGKEYVNHIDGNKLNNYEDNLEWVTASENSIHAVLNGLKPNTVKTNISTVISICEMIRDGYKTKEISEKLSVSKFTIKNIKNKIAWRYISDAYF